MIPKIKRWAQGGLLLFAFTMAATAGFCRSDSKGERKAVTAGPRQDTLILRADPGKAFQVMDNFGASDAWTCQYVGLWNRKVKRDIADLLFSNGKHHGDPKGIGLSAWRFNIGAGSTEQADKSGIRDPWRRAESFLQADGHYDFDKAAGQRWFLKAAKRRGVKDFIGFCNSAPYTMTENGLTYSTGGQTNLAADQYANFSTYLTNVIQGVKKKTGVLLDYISPVNEPQWDWSDGGQEGSPYRNNEIAALAGVLNTHLTRARLKTKISLAEAGQINYLYERSNKPQRGAQIQAFFSDQDSASILKFSHVDRAISAHSYFTTSPFNAAIRQRRQVAGTIDTVRRKAGLDKLRYWMSEYCVLGDNHGEIDGNHRDLGMNSALYIAKVIHMDLTAASASAWHWWLAISAYDYKDGLIYVDKTASTGKYYVSKMLWALGNYSRFIRPGYVRIGAEAAGMDPADASLLLSAFKDPSSSKLVFVAVNLGDEPRIITTRGNPRLRIKQVYITSDQYDLKHFRVKRNQSVQLPAGAIITLTGNYR